MKIKIATRASALALWQSEHIAGLLRQKGHEVELITMKTKGDVILDTPLAKIGGKGLFTKELENALLSGQADIAVHSLKDVPTRFEPGLELACVCSRANTSDALLSMKYSSLQALPRGAKIGTTSLRRQMQIRALRPDLELISLRGNVISRIQKLKDGVFDGIILAKAGIERLKLNELVSFISTLETIPAMGQGALGIEIASKNTAIKEAIAFLDDEKTRIETSVERAFVDRLNGGCQAPIGVNAVLNNEIISVKAVLGLIDASKILKDSKTYAKSEYLSAGVDFANSFIERGACELLALSEKMLENFKI
mgnify:FL=1